MLELKGAFRKHPERKAAREHEPAPTGPLGDPPREFDEAHVARWQEVAEWCSWLERADRLIVEATVRLWVKLRNNEMKSADWSLLTTNLSKLGMTPTDRSKVKVPPKPQAKTGFEEFA